MNKYGKVMGNTTVVTRNQFWGRPNVTECMPGDPVHRAVWLEMACWMAGRWGGWLGWKPGCLAGWLVQELPLAGWLSAWLAGWLLAGWLAGCLPGWLLGLLGLLGLLALVARGAGGGL